ncbi:MAG: sigma-70 family RNA polymerase sigma factor [Bacteroidetes bacterium]|nr:sigma-70 family RNA polymerase sigma factor [Bacteroidota bacterium]
MKDTDQDIIVRIAAGDKHGYGVLLERYRGKVMTLAMRMLGRREDAEEAAQDAFIRAFRSLHQFEQRAQFSTWLYRITYNVCATQLSRRRGYTQSIDDDDSPEIADPSGSSDGQLESLELRAALGRAIDKLRPEYASVITLFYMHEQSHEEICSITGLPIGTIKNRLHRARTELRQQLERNDTHASLLHT